MSPKRYPKNNQSSSGQFVNEAMAKLRLMLQLLQTDEGLNNRQKVQKICMSLLWLEADYNIPEWTELLESCVKAIANPQNSNEILINLVIKKIQYAFELILQNQVELIKMRESLSGLLPQDMNKQKRKKKKAANNDELDDLIKSIESVEESMIISTDLIDAEELDVLLKEFAPINETKNIKPGENQKLAELEACITELENNLQNENNWKKWDELNELIEAEAHSIMMGKNPIFIELKALINEPIASIKFAKLEKLINRSFSPSLNMIANRTQERQSGTTTPSTRIAPIVLIVDDSICSRSLLSSVFNRAGYEVEQARDGKDAWDKLQSGLDCDIIFCDIEMPKMNGLQLLENIHNDPYFNQIPVAMITSRTSDKHKQEAAKFGAKGYFTKPYLEEQLIDAAQRMMKGENLLNLTSTETTNIILNKGIV